MRKYVSIFFFLFAILVIPVGSTQASEADILREIRNLREDMNKRFEQVDKRFESIDKHFEQVDKRFDQVDKRFDQVDKRFEQFMWFFGLWVPLSVALVGYILQRINKHDDRFFELSRKNIEAEDIISAISRADNATKKRLKEILKG